MDTGQMLWGLNTILLGSLGFFIKNWMSEQTKQFDKMEARLDKKLDAITCVERNTDMKKECEKLRRHRHAPVTGEKGGEVILI